MLLKDNQHHQLSLCFPIFTSYPFIFPSISLYERCSAIPSCEMTILRETKIIILRLACAKPAPPQFHVYAVYVAIDIYKYITDIHIYTYTVTLYYIVMILYHITCNILFAWYFRCM